VERRLEEWREDKKNGKKIREEKRILQELKENS